MDDVFYLLHSHVTLKEIREIFISDNERKYKITLSDADLSLTLDYIYMGKIFVHTEWLAMYPEEFDAPDVKFLKEQNIKLVYCICHHPRDIELLITEFLTVLSHFGGFIGNDGDEFKPSFDSATVKNFQYL